MPAQLARWQTRGLAVADVAAAELAQRFIGYYCLKVYARPLRHAHQPKQPFKDGATFEQIMMLYRFDRELRLLTLDAIEIVEVAVRAVLNTTMCVRHGAHWFMDASHFTGSFDHRELLDRLDRELSIPPGTSAKKPYWNHKELFINHYYAKYTSPYLPPGWLVTEVLTMGVWSKIFVGLREPSVRKAISKPFQIDEKVLQSWLHAITHLRNFCAHHARVWNRQFAIRPLTAKKHAGFLPDSSLPGGERLYPIAVVLRELLEHITLGTDWHQRLAALLRRYPLVNPEAMGFPATWQTEELWGLKLAPA